MHMTYKVTTVKRMANKAIAALDGVPGRSAQKIRCLNILRMVQGHGNSVEVHIDLEDFNALTILPEGTPDD